MSPFIITSVTQVMFPSTLVSLFVCLLVSGITQKQPIFSKVGEKLALGP